MVQNTTDSEYSNETVPNDYLFWSLFIPVLLGCLGMAAALYYMQQDNGNVLGKLLPLDFRYIPPELIGYQQTSITVCPMKGTPQCFAVQNDSTFIVGSAHPPALYFFDAKGSQVKKIDLPEEPKAVVCGNAETILQDKVIVSMPTKIAIYDASGYFEFAWKTNNDDDIHSLVLTSDYLFAADSGNCVIHRFDENGGRSEFGSFVVYAAPITMTYSSQNDLLYIANPGKHRIEVFTTDGLHKPELSWGEPSGEISGFVGCCNPIGLAVLDGDQVLTVEKSASRIKIFGKDRKLDCVVAGANVLESIPAEIKRKAVAPGGRYFSAVPLPDGRIAVFDLEDAILRFFSPIQKN